MSINDWLPSGSPDVRENLNRLFSREVLGSVLVGKFIGDYLALVTTGALGVHLGYLAGIVVSVGVFVYWERVERAAKSAETKMSQKQTSLGEFEQQ